MRCGDLLSKALMLWVTKCGTELGSGAFSTPLCEASLQDCENFGKHKETALFVGQQLPQKEYQQLGHCWGMSLKETLYLLNTSINAYEQPLCQSFFYILRILQEARAEESNQRNRTAHEKLLELFWNIPEAPRAD